MWSTETPLAVALNGAQTGGKLRDNLPGDETSVDGTLHTFCEDDITGAASDAIGFDVADINGGGTLDDNVAGPSDRDETYASLRFSEAEVSGSEIVRLDNRAELAVTLRRPPASSLRRRRCDC